MSRPVLKLNADPVNPDTKLGHLRKPPHKLNSFISEHFKLGEIELCLGEDMNCVWVKLHSESPMFVDVQRETDVYMSKVSIKIYSRDPDYISIGLDRYRCGDSYKSQEDLGTEYSFRVPKNKFMSTVLGLTEEKIKEINGMCNLNFGFAYGF